MVEAAAGMQTSAADDAADCLMRVRGISKSYETNGNRIKVLRGIDFDLQAGESVAVVGASGIGKSTLLHILGGLDRPDSGRLLYRGQDILAFDAARMAAFRNASIGFVFQFHHLLPEFNALENTMMPALIRGDSRQDARRAAEEILVRVGLAERLRHPVSKLSGGEQQRVALARALVLHPPLLLADEPTGNLDRRNSDQIHDLLMKLNAELAMTLVVVTHNMELADRMSREFTITDGKLTERD